MLGTAYTVLGEASETTAQSLIRLTAPADAVLVITKAWIGIDDVDDLNEPMSAQIHIASTAGTGAAVTPRPMNVGVTGLGATAIESITADPTAGNILVKEPFNAAAGWVWTPFDESEALVVSPSDIIVLHLATAPSAAMNIISGMTFYEIGG